MEIQGLIDEEYVHTVIRRRPEDIHKGDCGRVLLAAGKRQMAGAAVLAGKAAIKTGSGLVHICTKKKVFPVLQTAVPELICTTWRHTKNELARYDAVAVGPGMGVSKRTRKILKRILKNYDRTVIIDADGLNALAGSKKLQELVRSTEAEVILTPHIGEAERLLGGISLKGKNKLEIASLLVQKYRCSAVVKGPETLVAVSGDSAYINTTGNPGMATAGSGDVLTGVIASLAGQKHSASEAARAGVFIHGLAGDLAAEKYGEYGLTAGNIAEQIPFALKKLTD